MEPGISDPVVVSGSGCCSFAPGAARSLDATPFLKSRKMRKFMGKQDELAVVAASMALEERKLDDAARRDRTGIYLAVGYIPFERADIDAMAGHSLSEGRFSIERFSTAGVEQVNPLLTFRCLPNMPIFHVSLNTGIQGPYFITYPGVGQFYQALERAVTALGAGEIDCALVGGVADQDNFLVAFDRKRKADMRDRVAYDAAAFLVLERGDGHSGGLELAALHHGYLPHDPWSDGLLHEETCVPAADLPCEAYLGPASLPAYIHEVRRSRRWAESSHRVRTRDGIVAESRWRWR